LTIGWLSLDLCIVVLSLITCTHACWQRMGGTCCVTLNLQCTLYTDYTAYRKTSIKRRVPNNRRVSNKHPRVF